MARSTHNKLSRLGRHWLSCALLALCTLSTISTASTLSTNTAEQLQQQRNDFLAAERALNKRQMSRYHKLLKQLDNYPLTPYLIHKDLSSRLNQLPYREVEDFLARHANSYLGDRLLKDWLLVLAHKKRWHEYQSYYQHHINTTELNCYYLRARLYNGETDALDDVAALWNVPKSQPKQCDPLFKRWINAGYLSADLVWQRHASALKARKLSLARYIGRLMPAPDQQKYIERYQAVYRNPHLVLKTSRYPEQTAKNKEIILYGLARVSRRDPLAALRAWKIYDAQQLFDDSDRHNIQETIAINLARKDEITAAEQLLSHNGGDSALVERMIRASLKELDWNKTLEWIGRLPEAERHSERWQYWTARALGELNIEHKQIEPAAIYESLALKRDFYGFLSADILGRDYKLVDRPVQVSAEMQSAISNQPGMQRAREFLAINRINSARREWLYSTADFGPTEMKAAATVAAQWNWHRQGIVAMAQARYWDDLQVRFPLAYQSDIESAAKRTQVEPHLLYAIARQESAFATDARSPVGAMGLMQLMPGTARDTARKAGIKYRKWDLLKPDTNIKLGSTYINQLLDKFDGNRILAAAAYNAGPHRVKRWLTDNRELPYDVWIEIIPYQETRKYVQNVLSYSVIYGYRLGDQKPLIRQREANRRL